MVLSPAVARNFSFEVRTLRLWVDWVRSSLVTCCYLSIILVCNIKLYISFHFYFSAWLSSHYDFDFCRNGPFVILNRKFSFANARSYQFDGWATLVCVEFSFPVANFGKKLTELTISISDFHLFFPSQRKYFLFEIRKIGLTIPQWQLLPPSKAWKRSQWAIFTSDVASLTTM